MKRFLSRREWLAQAAVCLPSVALAKGHAAAICRGYSQESPLTVISGKPRERGQQYGRKFKDEICTFRDKEFGKALVPASATRENVLRYAGRCGKEIRSYAPIAMEELEGIAEGAGLPLEEAILINCHEELVYHGLLPKIDHCAALAAGPPDTKDGNTYVGESYEWGWRCKWFYWKRPEGSSVLAYTYPGLLASVGLNSAGIALCATSAGRGGEDLRVGIPYYVLSAQMLYQETLEGAIEEAKRARHAGWCAMVLGDAKGQLANVEVARQDVAVEMHPGHLARHQYGSRQMTGTRPGGEVQHNERTKRMYDLLQRAKGKLDRGAVQGILEDPLVRGGPIDLMVFNVSQREAYVRGQAVGSDEWRTLRFQDK